MAPTRASTARTLLALSKTPSRSQAPSTLRQQPPTLQRNPLHLRANPTSNLHTSAPRPAAPSTEHDSLDDQDPVAPNTPLLDLRLASAAGPLPQHKPPQRYIEHALLDLARDRNIPIPASLQPQANPSRLPRSVQALYLAPLKHKPTHGIVTAHLQLRSYDARNLEFMADFALRAAYYLGLPASGPVPLPRITQRWTVPRDVFIFKKSQENWERVTMRRLIQIQDGHPEVVQRWLAFLQKWCWYGVGMKANVFETEGLEDALRGLDEPADEVLRAGMEGVDWELIGRKKGLEGAREVAEYVAGKGIGGGVTAPAAGEKKTAKA